MSRTALGGEGEEVSMGRFVIVAYTPKPGKEDALLLAVRKHLRILAKEGLVSDQPGCVMRSASGAIVEVFEWRSASAMDAAHSNTAVQALWEEFSETCEYTPLCKLPESKSMFAEFESVAL
jgi:hypothetical protein